MKGEGKEGPGVNSGEEWKLPSMTFLLVGPEGCRLWEFQSNQCDPRNVNEYYAREICPAYDADSIYRI